MNTFLLVTLSLAFLLAKVRADCLLSLYPAPNKDDCAYCGEALFQRYNGDKQDTYQIVGTDSCDWKFHLCLEGDGQCTGDSVTAKTKSLTETQGDWSKVGIEGFDQDDKAVHIPCLERDGVLVVFPMYQCLWKLGFYPMPPCVTDSNWAVPAPQRDWNAVGGQLKRLTIPDRVHTLYGHELFKLYSDLKYLDLNKVTHVEGITRLDSVEEFIAPELKTVVGDGFLENDLTLAADDSCLSVTAPKLETIAGTGAFYGARHYCTTPGDTSPGPLSLPSLKSLGDDAFYGSLITEFVAPKLESVGDDAFYGTLYLESFTAPLLTEANVGQNAFLNSGSSTASGELTINDVVDIILPDNGRCFLDKQQKSTLVRCESCPTGDIKLDSSVKAIGNSAFLNCNGLLSVSDAESVETIGSLAFSGCTSLKSISLLTADPNPVQKRFGSRAFEGCADLHTFKASASPSVGLDAVDAEFIGESAFAGCTSLQNVHVVDSQSSSASLYVGSNAFNGCESLQTFKSDRPVATILPGTFSGCDDLTVMEAHPATAKLAREWDDPDAACLASVGDAAALSARHAELQVQRVDAACAAAGSQ